MDGKAGRVIRQRLESLALAGVDCLPRAGADTTAPGTDAAAGPVVPNAGPVPGPQPPQEARSVPAPGGAVAAGPRDRALAVLRDEVAACTRCAELAAGRSRTVFGAGPADARIVFFGEAPGADEDATGEPFVGRAGQLLTKIIEACRLTREQVYIMNVLKCRPPGNRPPQADEVDNCRGFFERQFEILQPEFICCLGTSAAQALLRTTEPIGKLRRRWFTHGAARVICTYHPSYLLRNPNAKRDVWEDMKLLMGAMGVELH